MKVYLQIHTWVGTAAIGAEHYYGKLMPRGKAIEKLPWKRRSNMEFRLQRPMTAEEAEYRNKKERCNDEGGFRWKTGDLTDGFASEAAVREYAIKVWKKRFRKGTALIEEGRGECAPSRVLAGPQKLIEESKPLHEEAEALDYWENPKHDDRMKVLCAQWQALLKEYGVE